MTDWKKARKEEVQTTNSISEGTTTKGAWVKHGKTSKIGKVTNVSGDKSIVNVKWNGGGESEHEPHELIHMKEGVEQIDEISATRLMAYRDKTIDKWYDYDYGKNRKNHSHDKRVDDFNKNMDLATKKLQDKPNAQYVGALAKNLGKAVVDAGVKKAKKALGIPEIRYEETEQIDEISVERQKEYERKAAKEIHTNPSKSFKRGMGVLKSSGIRQTKRWDAADGKDYKPRKNMKMDRDNKYYHNVNEGKTFSAFMSEIYESVKQED